MHFEKESAVHKSLQRIVRRLEELGIPYAVAGAMALFFHGYERFTTDVDLLVRKEGLEEIHRRLEGLGYVAPFAGSKQLRDTDCMTRSGAQVIVILTAGAPDAFTHLQRRILALWDKVLDESGEPRPPAGVTDDHAQLIVPADTTAFLGTTRGWMGAPAA